MVSLKVPFLLAVMVTFAQAQDQPISGALLITITGLDPISAVYVNGFSLNPGTSAGNTASLAACAQECLNGGGCHSFAFRMSSTGSNCFTSPTCTRTTSDINADSGFSVFTLTKDCVTIVSGRLVSINNVMLTDRTGSAVFTNGGTGFPAPDNVACGLACEAIPTCVAAEFSSNTCTHFSGATLNPMTQTCPTTAAEVGTVSWIKPCNYDTATGWDDIFMTSLGTTISAGSPSNSNFESCQSTCETTNGCVGIRFSTASEFITTPQANRCQFYTDATVYPTGATPAICNATMVPSPRTWSLRKTTCNNVGPIGDFTKHINHRLIGGTSDQGATDKVACQMACITNTLCVGLDWNKLPNVANNLRCWLHFEDKGGCNDPIALSSPMCCDHYRRSPSRCSSENGYYRFNNLRIQPMGTLQTENSLASCRDACTASATCEGFDINTFNQCYFHTSSTVCGSLADCATCTHYRKLSFECTWKFNKKKITGGIGVSPDLARTKGDCEKICRMSQTCMGYDFNPYSTSNYCYTHTDATICMQRLSDEFVTHYRLRNKVCPNEPASTDFAEAQQNYHTLGNQLIDFAPSAIDCLVMCKTITGCEGIDYDKDTKKCYQVNRLNACNSGIADTCCDRIPLNSACMAIAVTGYGMSRLSHRLNGEFSRTGTTVQICAQICNDNSKCAAFDYDHNTDCWLHTKTQVCLKVNPIFGNNCCDHYVKKSLQCDANYSPPVFSAYNLVQKVHIPGGMEIVNKTTETLCTSACSSRAACQAVDFNFVDNRCWAHSNACPNKNSNEKVYHYVKKTTSCP